MLIKTEECVIVWNLGFQDRVFFSSILTSLLYVCIDNVIGCCNWSCSPYRALKTLIPIMTPILEMRKHWFSLQKCISKVHLQLI